MPTQSPLIRSSASGVSRTRSDPKRFCKPAVARKTPPLMPTSSPSTTTLGSSSIARPSARLTASTKVTSGIVLPREFTALRGIDLRQTGIEVIEHGFARTRCGCEIAFDCRLDALIALGRKLLLVRFAPNLLVDKIRPEARDRLFLPMSLNCIGRTIARCIIRGRVIAESVGDRLDEAGALAIAGCSNGVFCRGAYRQHIAAIDLLACESGGDRLLRQRFATCLKSYRYRYGPLIVGGDEHDRQLVHAGKIHRFVNIAFRGGAIAEHAHRDTGLPAQSEGIGNAGGMRCLGTDGNAEREIMHRSGEVIAPFVAAPKQQDLLQLDTAPDERAIVAIGRQQHVFLPHSTGYSN